MMPATVASLCKVPKRRPEVVERSLREAVGRGLYEGSELLERIRSGKSTYRGEAERMIREELEQAASNAECASMIVRLPNVRRASKAPRKSRKADPAPSVTVAEAVKAVPVAEVVPIRPEVGQLEGDARVEAYLARLVHGPKRDYCAALLRGERPADPGTDWARKVRERLAYYGQAVK